MSGSLVWRAYDSTIPSNATFSLQVDESNARATYNGVTLMPVGGLTGFTRPVGLKPRTISCVSANNPNLRRSFYVTAINLWQLIASDPNATIVASGSSDPSDVTGGQSITWTVVNAIAERNTRRPRGGDTGLIDGTAQD